MELKISLIFGFFGLQILQPSTSHSNSGSLGDIEFSCPAGQYFNGGNCYAAVSVEMTWSAAERTCKRQGQHLFWVLDVDELKAVDHLAKSTWGYYWSGLSQTESWLTANEALWSHSNETVSLEEVVWEDDQPDTRNGKCVYAKKNGYGAFGNCLRKLPFVCKSEAVLKDYFRCRSGEGIQSKFVCDGHNDCQDMSDEADCEDRCHHVINAEYASGGSKPSGEIVNTNILNHRSCFWSIVTNIGSTIKVQVKSFNTEKNADVVEFRTGGREGEIFLAELTGTLAVNNQPVYYSSDNVFNIRLVTDNTEIHSGGFRFSWTTDVPEVFNDVKMIHATTSVQDLKSPFYDTGNFPQEKVFEWKITASTLNVITLEFEYLDIGKDSKLYLWDQDDISLDPTLDGVSAFKPKHYISKSKSIRLMLITGREEAPFPKGIYIKYWEGCNITYMSKEGKIQSPGYVVGSYPENVECTWIIERPTSETRTMALRFNMFNLQAEKDYLKIYNDTNETLHTGDGFTGSANLTNNFEVRSTNGSIKLVFTTNYVLTDNGFEAEFSLDCAELDVSPETSHISSSEYETSFMNTIEMSCADGYSFVNEGRSNVHSIKCEKGGEWNETRIPNCMITYCPIPPAVDNGYIVESSGVKVDNNVTYKCNDGFTMNGEPVIKCMYDGNWEDAPRCTAAECPDLTTPGNGAIETLIGNGKDFASVVQYVCDPGYETYGNVTTYCQTGGIWSHDPPTCEKISCPMPRFQRGNLSPNDTLKFDADINTTLTCDSGFGINGTETQTQVLKCESDGRLSPYVSCLDVDECNETIVSPKCHSTQNCHNTIGGYMCTCKDGYYGPVDSASCTNINECSSNNGIGPCDQSCQDSTPGYTCGCNAGFVLYTAEGISNISLADGEDGEREGDVYHINHTCVRKQCPVPPSLDNGKVLSKKELFFFEDSVEFTCDHGYELNTSDSKLNCIESGMWSKDYPICQVATCMTPTTASIARSTNIYPAGSSVEYGIEVNIECQYGSMKINRTLYCSYNVISGRYELLGDAPECPEIDCGQPEEVPGSMYSGLTNTTLNSSFTFECNSGFERSGMSLDVNGINNVTCQENGRWNIGNLTCTGGRCKDPGTPGGAMQNVTSYEVGQMVYFICNNSGYFPEPPQPLECVVDTTGNITWNATLEDGSADIPECLDKTRPVFSNCPSNLIYVNKTEEYTYPVLTATDNSGAVENIHNPEGYRPSGLRTNSDIDITYTAKDFSGNTADCVIKIRVRDYARHNLRCPQNITIHIDTASGEVFNVSDVVSATPSDSNLSFTFSPGELITLDYKAMAEQKKVVVIATDKWGAEDQCSFFVETKADACFRESFPASVSNAAPVTCTSGNISCTVTCNSGYVFFDGNTTKTYDCTGQNMWMPALPPDTCIKYDEPSYIIVFQVVYKADGDFAKNCKSGHDDKIKASNASLTTEISNICNNDFVSVGPVVITHTETTTTGFDFRTSFTIKLLSTDLNKIGEKDTCTSLLAIQVKRDEFLDYTGSLQCTDGPTVGTATVVRHPSDSQNQVISNGNQCDNGIKKMTTVDPTSSKCIPCPPGTYSGIGDECNICPDGQFQNNFGQDKCSDCPSGNPVPSEDKTTCLAVCPAGFISVDGLPTCMPCPEDYYWVNKTYCEPCPNSGNTLGKDAIPDVNGCKEPCDTGEYSVTGYAPCKKCPINFYQDQTAQEMCKPCGNSSITQRSGSNDSSLCIQLGETQCSNCSQEERARTCEDRCGDAYNNTLPCQCNDGCVAANNCCDDYQWKCVDICTGNADDCSGQGACSYKNHRRFCTCNPGYKGDNCETELNPCDSNPCWNDGVCNKINSTNFNCTCTVETSCEMNRTQNKVGRDSRWGAALSKPSVEDCEKYCLENQTCESIHFVDTTCFIYYQSTLLDDKEGAVYSKKQCFDTKLFGCDRCEDDLVNSCKPDSCSKYGMCQDLLGDNSNCLCPITGRYTRPKCERVSDQCNPNPCGSNGECKDYSVRYQCICNAGWTGKKCDVNINECVENPNGCLYNGTCMDQMNKYTCSCKEGFTGDKCQIISDFCSSNTCQNGICYENYDTLSSMCKCEDPYRNDAGGSCEKIPACDNVNCTNGTCVSGKCICETGFEGSLCQHNIDDCMNMPCQHGGTCTDMTNSYVCQCVTGYDGDNCEINIDDCVGMCTGSNVDPNTNGCRDMLDDYQCICKAGYTGKNCTEKINECEQEYPCEHGGTCTDKVADFECSCREGWTGKRCETPIEYCDPLPCANEGVCFNLTDRFFCRCPGGSTGVTCGNSPEVCSIIDPCTVKGTCEDKGASAQCNCSDDYAGSSCQLIKDHCADLNPCKHDGKCVTNLIGFKCECDDGYSGSTCSLYTDPCSSNPCHSTAKCISSKDKYMCYCEQGNTLTDSGCKGIDMKEEDFDIFMDRYIDGMPAYLRNPIVSHTNNSMTIMFWIRVLARPGENPVLLSLEGIQIGSKPTFNPEMQQFIATSQYLKLRNSTDMKMVQYDTDSRSVADGKWHFMVFSWEPSGEVKIFIDSIMKKDEKVMTFDMNEDIYLQMIIGSADTHGRISKLRMYKKVFTDGEIFRAKDSDLPIDELKQGWTNIVLSRSTSRIYPSGAGNDTICDLSFPDCLDEDRTKPSISCPDDQTKHGTERLTAFTNLTKSISKNEDVKYVNTSVHDDELYIYGSSNEVFVAYDEAMNYEICRFKVYVRYADECQMPETDADVEYCSPNSKHICGLNCRSGALSLQHKLKYRCGALGVYNFEHPRKKFILPTCGDNETQTIALTIRISYKFEVTCIDTFKENINTTLGTKLKNLNDTWPGINWCGTQCVWNAECRGTYADVSFTLPGLSQKIQRGSETYTVKEAMLIFILQEEGLNFKNVAGAKLEKDSVTVDENPSCPSGYTVVGDTCVVCGRGTYRNDTTMSCEFCPIGSYQPNVGKSLCMSCQAKTTLTFGSYSSTDCIDDCPPGEYYDADSSNCAQCERHHYQDTSGQEFCYPCPIGRKTSEKGSNSSESCYKDCDAGTELQSDGSCKVCERGFYRTQKDDQCKSCVEGMTTKGEKSAAESDCEIKICYAGNFRNATTNECQECPVGWYQSEKLQDKCEKCPDKYTTDAEGKTHKDNCTFYCNPGKEVLSAESETCRNCPRGSYRSNIDGQILLPCQNCTGGNTTELDGSIRMDECSISKCEAGQILDNTGACEDCGMDTYQPDELPKSDTTCKPCNDNTNSPQKGTMDKKSTSVDKCILVCKEGQQNDGTSCSACPQGTWSNGNMTMRFEMCYNCSEDWTTEGTGSTHPDNCTLRDCDPGYYISGDNCEPCGFAQYQPNRHAYMCTNCSVDQNTSKIASTSQSACQIYCPKGQEGNVSCSDCQTNYIKQTAGIAACIPCEGNYTSNPAHDACNILFCDKGLYEDMENCVPCEIGKYKDERGNNTCKSCDAGYTTAGSGSDNKQDCNVLYCEKGKFENTTSNQCEVCPVKTYKSVVGNTNCIDCNAKKTTADNGTTSADGCSVEYCEPGYKRNASNNSCEKCAVGKYQPEHGMITCLSCDTGYTTASTGTVDQTDCYQICPIGFQFDSDKKVCVGCLLGFYKDTDGNAGDCKKCPVDKTTENANSTSVDDCNVDDCPAGYRRESPGCVECKKGTYQDESSQLTCDSCGSGYTTEKTGSTKQVECIKECVDGMEYDFATKNCTACLQGFYTNHTTTEKCIQCPSGQTTAYSGSNKCFQNTVATSAPPLPSTIEMEFVFRATFDCNDQAVRLNYKEHVRLTIIKQLKTLAKTYPLLCTSAECTNVNLLVISITTCTRYTGSGRRRRAVEDNQLSFNVQVPDVPATVTSNETNPMTRPAESVIQEDLTINKDQYAPLYGDFTQILTPLTARVNRTIKTCPTGQTQIGSNCVDCPVGTRSSPSQCIDCELNTYQDETGQTTCKNCSGSVMKYTLATGSTSSSQCISICDKTPTYCYNLGTCRADQHSIYCTCTNGYEGSRCNSKAERTSSNTAIIGGAVGGGVGLLVIILIVVIVCSRFYGDQNGSDDLDKKKFNRTYDMESDAPYRNPMYDNRAYPRPMLAAYPYNWGSDPYDHDPYAPYMAQKQIRGFESDEDYYQPRGTPKGTPRHQTHEWHAAEQT